MSSQQKQAVLNRALFTQRSFDSSRIAVLSTLIHRFAEAGDYEVFVSRTHRTPLRLEVSVVDEDAPYQHNLDLATLQTPEKRDCCQGGKGLRLHAGGVLGFYTSQGVSTFQVRISRLGGKEKQVLLNHAEQIPAGDFFTVTPLLPGMYRVSDPVNKAEMILKVTMPPVPEQGKVEKGEKARGERRSPVYRPDQPVLITVGKKGFDRREASLFSGQTLVFQVQSAARLRVDLEKEDAGTTPPKKRPVKPPRPKQQA
ncbi:MULTISPECIES: hypothetical protein [Anaerolinea]|uniref:Uncharacterized protein n=1 Tax=Anaerolinea thermophila (strain DSM 14523 / JCM 11388 / NBRC 100420 / UNI-1) TaxID=926569 RepID=E8N0C7_ANATU|nr:MULTISPECIES: hypothetical protein [Anaerolinea]BAJ64676.1 hypothetical protein ANT_26500 [Anaerolinea thermophila UNI-1]